MQGPAIGLLGFAAVVLLIVLRVPVGIAMGVVGAIGYGFVYGFATLGFVLWRAPFDAVFPVSLSVVPLFVMMGVFAGHAGLSKSLYALVASFIGHFRADNFRFLSSVFVFGIATACAVVAMYMGSRPQTTSDQLAGHRSLTSLRPSWRTK